MRVIGTAGHIDHGKTALVRMLTGVELDTLPEEQERGITIALGFTALTLSDGTRAALVDVPGHERLVRTMVAGATGIDAVLLVVSAVDGVMPQTIEHLQILQLLGIRHGVVALSMVDRSEPELVELVELDVNEALANTALAGAPILRTSAVTGEGHAELLAALTALAPPERPTGGSFRMPVDRSFVRPGFGTVVTGTAWSGAVAVGQQVHLQPGPLVLRVRGVHHHGEDAGAGGAGQRLALNLASTDPEVASRGTVVSATRLPESHVVDVHFTPTPDGRDLPDGLAVRVLCGTAELHGRLHLALDTETLAMGPAQLRLESPLPCLPGDRFIVRRESPVVTLGGGVVVDPWAPKMRRRDRVTRGAQIGRLLEGDAGVWLERAGPRGVEATDWARRTEDAGALLAGRIYRPADVDAWRDALVSAVAAQHRARPLAEAFDPLPLLLSCFPHHPSPVRMALAEDPRLRRTAGGGLALAGHRVDIDASDRAAIDVLTAAIEAQGLTGAVTRDLVQLHPTLAVRDLLVVMANNRIAFDVPQLGWVTAGQRGQLIEHIQQLLEHAADFAPADLKSRTGLTRKHSLPLLEWLDASGITRFGAKGRRSRGPSLP